SFLSTGNSARGDDLVYVVCREALDLSVKLLHLALDLRQHRVLKLAGRFAGVMQQDLILRYLKLSQFRVNGIDLQIEARSDSVGELRAERVQLLFRSEEHTSELQSRENIVCRHLLETKKIM